MFLAADRSGYAARREPGCPRRKSFTASVGRDALISPQNLRCHLWETRHFFLPVQKEVAKEKARQRRTRHYVPLWTPPDWS